jgi:hypothetical protein
MDKVGSDKVWLAKKHHPELREWINVLVGISALLLAAVSFWTTARISGLEDYLRSEISRRNSELDELSQRSREIEKVAIDRERQLARLDAATNQAIAASLLTQSELARSQNDLGSLRVNVATAKEQLASAKNSKDVLQEEFVHQTRDFELFQRQQAYQISSTSLWSLGGMYIYENLNGEAAVNLAGNVPKGAGNATIRKYIQVIKDRTTEVCPSLSKWQPTLPSPPKEPGFVGEDYDVSAKGALRMSKAEWQANDAAYSKVMKAYEENRKKYDEDRWQQTNAIIEMTQRCMCKTLRTAAFSEEKICLSE